MREKRRELTFDGICSIREENLNVLAVVAILSQQVVKIADIVLVVREGESWLPASGHDHRLITHLENAAGGVDPLMGGFAPLCVVL